MCFLNSAAIRCCSCWYTKSCRNDWAAKCRLPPSSNSRQSARNPNIAAAVPDTKKRRHSNANEQTQDSKRSERARRQRRRVISSEEISLRKVKELWRHQRFPEAQ